MKQDVPRTARSRRREVGAQREDRGARSPVVRFVLFVAVLFAAFHLFGMTHLYKSGIFPTYLAWNAWGSARLLSFLGDAVQSTGNQIYSKQVTLEVQAGCDAVEPAVLLMLGILAAPVHRRAKVIGLGIGVPILLILNLVRIVTLFLAARRSMDLFQLLHIEIWRPVFVLLLLSLWVVWAVWATGPESRRHAA